MNIRRTLTLAALATCVALPSVEAQERGSGARDAYFRAVAEFFSVPASEVSILGDWQLPPEEIPVALFVANQAGVSPEALVALRRSGKSWSSLAARYQVGAAQLYVPLPNGAEAGVLQAAYDRYREVPASSWSTVSLGDADIVALVNLRVLAQTLHKAPEQVLAAAAGGDWVAAYARLLRRPGGREKWNEEGKPL